MRTTARIVAVSLVCLGVACARGPAGSPQKLVILGFDGMDPDLVGRWMDEGKLPNLQALAHRGAFRPLATTMSADTPTAWASFATGVNPGKHNVFDMFVRDPQTYRIDLGLMRRVEPRFLFGYLPVRRGSVTSTRAGTSFWVTAGRSGIRSSVITVPVTYPPENVPNGELLAGLPLPDIRGTMGTYSYFGTDVAKRRRRPDRVGRDRDAPGLRRRRGAHLAPRTRGPHAAIFGARPAPAAAPHSLESRRAAARRSKWATPPSTCRKGEWSKWIDVTFSANLLVRYHGMTQFYPGRRRLRVPAVRLAAQLEARPGARPDVGARFARRRSLRTARPLSHARLGGHIVAAQRRPHRRAGVHGGPEPRVRRPHRSPAAAARRRTLGSARRRHRVDRPRAAHDVASHRHLRIPCTTPRSRPPSATPSNASTALRRFRGRGGVTPGPLHADTRRVGARVPLVPPGGQPEHVAGPGRLHDTARRVGPGAGAQRRLRHAGDVLEQRRLVRIPARTRLDSARFF